jgi:hypothetical protein
MSYLNEEIAAVLTVVGTRCADHATLLYPQELELTSQTSGGPSVGIVPLQMPLSLFFGCQYCVRFSVYCTEHKLRHISIALQR